MSTSLLPSGRPDGHRAGRLSRPGRQRIRRCALWAVLAGSVAVQAATGNDPRNAPLNGVVDLVFAAAGLGLFIPWVRGLVHDRRAVRRFRAAQAAGPGLAEKLERIEREAAEARRQSMENSRHLAAYDEMFSDLGGYDPAPPATTGPQLRVVRGGRDSDPGPEVSLPAGPGPHLRGRRARNGSRPA